MQTKAGGITLRNTMIKKFGSEEKWKEFMQQNGKRGSEAWNERKKQGIAKPKGFAAMTPEKVSAAGKRGGTNSRRNRK